MCRKHGLAGPAIWWKPTPVARRHPSIRNSEPIEIGTLLLSPEPLTDLKPSERFPSRGSRTRRRRAGRPGARGAGAFAEAGSAGSSVPGAGRGVPTCCRVGAAPSPSRAVGPPSIDVARRPRRAPAPRNPARSSAQTTHESVRPVPYPRHRHDASISHVRPSCDSAARCTRRNRDMTRFIIRKKK